MITNCCDVNVDVAITAAGKQCVPSLVFLPSSKKAVNNPVTTTKVITARKQTTGVIPIERSASEAMLPCIRRIHILTCVCTNRLSEETR
jgi:hypothetical protein